MRRNSFRYLMSLIALPLTALAVTIPALTVLHPDFGTLDEEGLECGTRLVAGLDYEVSRLRSIRVALVTDEEWRERVPDLSGEAARRVVLEAASLFRGLGIHLLVVRTVDWVSPDSSPTIHETWEAAHDQVAVGDEDIAIVLTAQPRSTTVDGHAPVGGHYVAVAHHTRDPALDSLVLAHELSHLFGANHACDVSGRDGLMTATGFDYDLICPCTRRILDLNAERFHRSEE